MPDRRPPPIPQVAYFLGDPLTGEVGRLDEPPTIGESESIPQVLGDSHWIEVAVIGALLIAAFSAGAFAFVKIYGVFA